MEYTKQQIIEKLRAFTSNACDYCSTKNCKCCIWGLINIAADMLENSVDIQHMGTPGA